MNRDAALPRWIGRVANESETGAGRRRESRSECDRGECLGELRVLAQAEENGLGIGTRNFGHAPFGAGLEGDGLSRRCRGIGRGRPPRTGRRSGRDGIEDELRRPLLLSNHGVRPGRNDDEGDADLDGAPDPMSAGRVGDLDGKDPRLLRQRFGETRHVVGHLKRPIHVQPVLLLERGGIVSAIAALNRLLDGQEPPLDRGIECPIASRVIAVAHTCGGASRRRGRRPTTSPNRRTPCS